MGMTAHEIVSHGFRSLTFAELRLAAVWINRILYLFFRPVLISSPDLYILAMEFAYAPLEALLERNEKPDELLSYLEQLDERFRETDDEKDRFGALQILLPTLKAYLTRLTNVDDKEKALDTYLRPLMLMSFSHDSMVATESVSLLSDAVAHWMARFVLEEKENTFGDASMTLFLGQLILAMEIEPDFVDLLPMRFIESNMGDSPAWEKLHSYVDPLRHKLSILDNDDATEDSASVLSATTAQSTQLGNRLDLECCLDVLNRFVEELSGFDDATKPVDDWLDATMTVAVAMLSCTDPHLRMKLTNDLIPNLFRAQENKNKREGWCQVVLFSIFLSCYCVPYTAHMKLTASEQKYRCFGTAPSRFLICPQRICFDLKHMG